ncbi:hypothetical protein IWW48_001971 [Coemansia sp. RSA 1200]|nr:hypothetical protein IWW48_001971 [Coemansia sp. RSA 1200]
MNASATEFFIPTEDPEIRLHARLVVPKHDSTDGSRGNKQRDGEAQKQWQQKQHWGVFVICHGLLDTKDTELFQSLQQHFAEKAAVGSVAFDFRGNGRSTGVTGYGDYAREAEDIAKVVDHVRRKLGERVIGVLGHSKGASSMLLYAVKYGAECPPLVVSISARFWIARETHARWKEHQLRMLEKEGRFLWRSFGGAPAIDEESGNGRRWASTEPPPPVREYWITRQDLEDRSSVDMRVVQALPLHRVFVLNVAGDADRVVPTDDVWAYVSAMSEAPAYSSMRVSTQVVPGGTHFWTTSEERARLFGVIDKWLDAVLPLAKL